jgi:hypothetical protein
MEERVKGNSCTFCMFRTLNLFLILVGLGIVGAGAFVCAQDGSFNWYNGSFIFLGLSTVLVAVLGHKSRYSVGRITFYVLCLFLMTAAMIGFTIGIIAYSDFSNTLGEDKANAVRYSLLAGSVIMGCTLFWAWCYRRSIKWARFENDNDPSKRKLINMPIVTPKTDKRRDEMNEKYAALRKN